MVLRKNQAGNLCAATGSPRPRACPLFRAGERMDASRPPYGGKPARCGSVLAREAVFFLYRGFGRATGFSSLSRGHWEISRRRTYKKRAIAHNEAKKRRFALKASFRAPPQDPPRGGQQQIPKKMTISPNLPRDLCKKALDKATMMCYNTNR